MATIEDISQETQELFRHGIKDPIIFSRVLLQADLWDLQEKILRSVATKPRTAIKACHASGKTFLLAMAVLWYLARWEEAVVVTTAPTWNQVERLLWGEVHTALGRSRYPFPKPLKTEIHLGPKRYAFGLSTSVTHQNRGVRFQGFHAEHVLMILDEAPGIDQGIWEAIEGARAGGDVRVLAAGNPTITGGPYYDAFGANREGWEAFTIGAFETPNLAGLKLTYTAADGKEVTVGSGQRDLMELTEDELDRNARPYLITKRWVKEKFHEWGPGHALWDSRVLGQFPAQGEDCLLPLSWLERAKNSDKKGTGKACAGLDVAGPGEAETVLTIRRGPEILKIRAWPQEDPRGDVVAELKPYLDAGDLEVVNVDSAGIGWYIHLHLKDLKMPSVAVNVGTAARDTELHANLKAELYWALRMRAQAGDLCGLGDEKTIGQLTTIRYKHNARGQIVIEGKDDARKRGVKSPDRAESVMLAFATRPKTQLFAAISVEQTSPWRT
jgi:phage terminase large subunit